MGEAQNISTRVDVQTGENVAIGGFIIDGLVPKQVVIRALGPSLTSNGVTNALPNPFLELRDVTGGTVAINDDWKDNSVADQALLTLNKFDPDNNLESALVRTLDPGLYTAIVSGSNGTTGIGLVEVYNIDDPSVGGELANISTRGLVGSGQSVLIGGVIIGPKGGPDATVLIRGIGPSLADNGIDGPLADPFLELRNADADLIISNDNWMDADNSDDIEATQLAPTSDAESAILANLTVGAYTAIVSGNGGTGVGLVEIYHVNP